MKVTWLNTDPQIASARLRSLIPRKILQDQGLVWEGQEVIVAAKHGWNPLIIREACKRMIMDVCDDHFRGPLASHYRLACGLADVVTCNSKAMQQAIKDHTGKDAVVIDDPYEDPELEPAEGEGVLWFGHSSNMRDLDTIAAQISYPLHIVNNDNYTPDVLDRALKACRCTIIPSGHKKGKSANRAIRSIRYGKYPVCGPLPAHEELGLGLFDIKDELDEAMKCDMSGVVRHLQDKVRERFCPQKVAKDWYGVLAA